MEPLLKVAQLVEEVVEQCRRECGSDRACLYTCQKRKIAKAKVWCPVEGRYVDREECDWCYRVHHGMYEGEL